MLKLGVNEPEIVEVSAAEPELNRPYNTNNNNNRNWNNNNNNRNWNNNNNNRNWNNNRNNNSNYNRNNNRQNNAENPQVNLLSTPPQKPYDIVPNVWNTPANVTIGELLTNPTYRRDLQTTLNMVENRDVLEVEPITTTALKMNARIGDFVISTTPDSGSATSVISSSLTERLGLTVQQIPVQKVRTLIHKVEISGAIENVPIQIGQART